MTLFPGPDIMLREKKKVRQEPRYGPRGNLPATVEARGRNTMAGVKEKKKAGFRRGRKEARHISDQLEEKFVGAKTEVFSRITAKEAEIRSKVNAERTRAERLMEDAKGEAAAIKRKATLEEIGNDVYQRTISDAREEVERIEKATVDEVAAVEERGRKNLEAAVDFIIKSVLARHSA